MVVDHCLALNGGLTFVHTTLLQNGLIRCYDVTIEPPLQHLSGETILQIDKMNPALIFTLEYFGGTSGCLSDVTVFHPNAPSYYSSSILILYGIMSSKRKENAYVEIMF